KSGHEHRRSVASVLDLLLVKQRAVRLQCEVELHWTLNSVRCCCAWPKPSRIVRIEALSPDPTRYVFKLLDWTLIEVKDRKHLVFLIPAAHRKHILFFEAEDVHFVFG